MYASNPYIAQQAAHEYTRDRIREAETHRAAQHARVRARRTGRPRAAVVRRVVQPRSWFAAGRTIVA